MQASVYGGGSFFSHVLSLRDEAFGDGMISVSRLSGPRLNSAIWRSRRGLGYLYTKEGLSPGYDMLATESRKPWDQHHRTREGDKSR
jgi:hypothetical protein